jgi:glycosyltransferase involved in cell wall biosynthesis
MKISIITVSFNSAKTIRQTIESVLAQDYPDLEYIVVDGASKDGTVDILKEYEGKIK